jgi:hypothetical protein
MTAPPVQAPQRHADADAHERHQRAAQGDNRRSQPSCPKYLTAASMNNRTRTNITDAGPRDPAAGPDFGQLPGIAESRRLMAAGPSPNRHPPAFPRNMPGVTVPRRAPAVAYQLSSIDHNRPPVPEAGRPTRSSRTERRAISKTKRQAHSRRLVRRDQRGAAIGHALTVRDEQGPGLVAAEEILVVPARAGPVSARTDSHRQ